MAAMTLDGLATWPLAGGLEAPRETERTGPPEEPGPPEPRESGCVLYTADSLHEAQLVLDRLSEAGIAARLFNEHLVGALGELPMSQCWPKIWLADRSRLADARAIVGDYESRKRADTDVDADRACEHCGELSPGNFELCWSCRAPFDDD